MKPQYFKLLIILSVILFVYLIYKIYQEDVHVWTCESENNAPSCTVVGLMSEENGNPLRALNFYQLSCEKDYSLGCFHLGNLYLKMGEKKKARKSLEKACELDLKMACAQLEEMAS